jgi:hypothetical protein
LSFEKKKQLLNDWLNIFKENFKIEFAAQGQKVNKDLILERIRCHCTKFNGSREYIYLLCVSTSQETIPVYIGKSVNPTSRWRGHISKLLEGKGSYSHWKNLLIREDDIATQSLILLIIPENRIENPPIPNFPTTVGSVEYQLVSLVSDAYPETLLNKEGNRR